MPTVSSTGLSPPPLVNMPTNPTPRAGASPEDAGKAFEGMFASMLLKQMRQSMGGSTLFGSDKSDALGGLFDQFMGQHLASQGGLGIGKMIRRQLELRSTTHEPQQPQRLPAAYTSAANALRRSPAP